MRRGTPTDSTNFEIDQPNSGRITSKTAKEGGTAAVSAISFWEVGLQIPKGRLRLITEIAAWRRDLLNQGLGEIPVDGDIAARAGLLEDIHGDPADRLIVATALGRHRLVTADELVLSWPGKLNRLDARE